jgi:hypothetical protein
MCMGVYVAADVPLPLMVWDEHNPGFNVTAISEYEQPVRSQFSKSHVYYLGSYTGCSCSFSQDTDESTDPASKSQEALISYIAQATVSGTVELFVCWEGDWQKAPRERLELTLEDLRDTNRWFRELVFMMVKI